MGSGSEQGDAGPQGAAREAADFAALSRLLRETDESIVVPEDLWERITEPRAATGIQPGAVAAAAKHSADKAPVGGLQAGSRFISGKRWLYLLTGVVAVVALAAGAFWAGVSW